MYRVTHKKLDCTDDYKLVKCNDSQVKKLFGLKDGFLWTFNGYRNMFTVPENNKCRVTDISITSEFSSSVGNPVYLSIYGV